MRLVLQTPLTEGSKEKPWRGLFLTESSRLVARVEMHFGSEAPILDVLAQPFGGGDPIHVWIRVPDREPEHVAACVRDALRETVRGQT